MAYHIKDASTFLLEFIAECEKQEQIIPEDIMHMFNRFLRNFLASNGIEMLSPDLQKYVKSKYPMEPIPTE